MERPRRLCSDNLQGTDPIFFLLLFPAELKADLLGGYHTAADFALESPFAIGGAGLTIAGPCGPSPEYQSTQALREVARSAGKEFYRFGHAPAPETINP